jgi:hypothetical protein
MFPEARHVQLVKSYVCNFDNFNFAGKVSSSISVVLISLASKDSKTCMQKLGTPRYAKTLGKFWEGKLNLNECCRKYKISKKTFLRRLKGQVKRAIARSTLSENGKEAALPT